MLTAIKTYFKICFLKHIKNVPFLTCRSLNTKELPSKEKGFQQNKTFVNSKSLVTKLITVNNLT